MLSLTLRFDAGTLLLDASDRARAAELEMPEYCQLDPRVGRWRAPADRYRSWFADLHRRSESGAFDLADEARKYEVLDLSDAMGRTPRYYQQEAVDAWVSGGRRGQIILPTGAGKSFVAHRVIQRVARSALIVVPTLDLMNQWYDGLLSAFALDEVGLLGGGYHDVRPLTVTTYDSFYIHMPRIGDRFGLLVFDESHHLPGPTYLQAASMAIAPFRLGLTATLERQDGRHRLLDDAIGPVVYERGIKDLAGEFLADYDTIRVTAELTDAESDAYAEARAIYLGFVRQHGIRFGGPGGWGQFIMLSSQSKEGRRAMRAYRAQRQLALSCDAKLRIVERLVAQHHRDRVIIFTNDNPTVYAISRQLLAPAITHQTPIKERRHILKSFNDGSYPVVVTARVLNEGVDVPEANVAIVLSGTSSVREHVQRLGRILRAREGKRALLYEVITAGTVEESVSERRREHDAYR